MLGVNRSGFEGGQESGETQKKDSHRIKTFWVFFGRGAALKEPN